MAAPHVTIKQIPYHGWPESLMISNGTVEAVIVPAIGRVMQFRFVGEEPGTFWENRKLDGHLPNVDAGANGWLNFGGDKTWPAPQSEWERHTGREWPPPSTFDSAPFCATSTNDAIELVSKVDPHYGVRAVRRLRLAGHCAQLEITTEFLKEQGAPVEVSVWAITQLSEPERIFILLPEETDSSSAYQQLRGPTPRDLQCHGRLLSLRRHPGEHIKIGTQGTSMLWVDPRLSLLIRSKSMSPVTGDDQSRTEVYTNPDPQRYVELETVGPLARLQIYDRISWTNTYTLFRRSTPDCFTEAHRVFGLA